MIFPQYIFLYFGYFVRGGILNLKLVRKEFVLPEGIFAWNIGSLTEEQKCCLCPVIYNTYQNGLGVQRYCRGCFLGDGTDICEQQLFKGFWTEMVGQRWGSHFASYFCQEMAFSTAVFISCSTMPWEEMQYITSFSRNSKTQSQVSWAAWLCCSWTSQMKA